MKDIKLVFLDWHNTLCTDIFWQHLNGDENKEVFDGIVKSVFVNNADLVQKWMCGKANVDDVLEIVCSDTGISKKFILENLIYSSRSMKFVSPEIPVLIKKIRDKGIKVVLASDNMDVFENTIEALDLRNIFDDILLSNNLGCMKKHVFEGKSNFFNDYINKNNLSHKDCVLIDDSKNVSDMCKIIGLNNIVVCDCKNNICNILKSFI